MNLTTDKDQTMVIDDEPFGELHYAGDVRRGSPVAQFVRTLDGLVVTPIAVAYDEETDRSTVTFGLAQQIPTVGWAPTTS